MGLSVDVLGKSPQSELKNLHQIKKLFWLV